jgi:hypothetical protein
MSGCTTRLILTRISVLQAAEGAALPIEKQILL